VEFFDPDEEVIDFQLTPYGKQLLSKGRLRPHYYAFFDDDVVYDSEYMDVTQTQNANQPRIMSETPRMHTQAVYDGIETNVKKLIADSREKRTISSLDNFVIQPEKEKHYSLSLPLGNVRSGYEYDSAIKVNFLHGALSGSVSHISGTDTYNIKIPQLVTTASVITQVDYNDYYANWEEEFDTMNSTDAGSPIDVGVTGLENPELSPDIVYHSDGTYINVTAGGILLSIEEEGTPFIKDNFEIEIYEIEEEIIPMPSIFTPGDMDIKKEKLIPLYFEKPQPLIVNNILLDEKEIADRYANSFITPEKARLLANYFFECYVDEEISDTIMCDYVMKMGKHIPKDIFNDRPIKCPEEDNVLQTEELYLEDDTGEC